MIPHSSLDDVEENCVVLYRYHDNDTTVGWFNGGRRRYPRTEQEIIEEPSRSALKVTGGTPETIHLDMIRLAFNSKAKLAIAPMQDFLGLGSDSRLEYTRYDIE